ncbi:hypothetical protein GT037_000794, partial [Alternaria burnsii]
GLSAAAAIVAVRGQHRHVLVARVQRRVQQITVPASHLARARAVALTTARPSGSMWTPAHSVAQSLPLVVVLLLLLLLSPLPSPLSPLPSQSPAPWFHPICAATAKRIRPRRSALVDASAGAAFLTSRLHRSPPRSSQRLRDSYPVFDLSPWSWDPPAQLASTRTKEPKEPTTSGSWLPQACRDVTDLGL